MTSFVYNEYVYEYIWYPQCGEAQYTKRKNRKNGKLIVISEKEFAYASMAHTAWANRQGG